MAYIKKKSERKFKITVCNGYKVNGQKRMKAQTITVPSSVPKRGIQQYVMAEAERIEKNLNCQVFPIPRPKYVTTRISIGASLFVIQLNGYTRWQISCEAT